MPTKARIPAPIDRPLSRAYLRQFLGWSTAFPPGASEPASLRLMENVMVNRDGSVRVRPGLRYINYTTPPNLNTGAPGISEHPTVDVVGSHETFFLNDGNKAYLYAVREADETIGFRVLATTVAGQIVQTLADAGFSVPQTSAVLNFTSATTYVKYLQIDNKVFALSNAGEEMRLFLVGDSKTAKKLNNIERPNWELTDKLTVVHPDAAWLGSGVPTSTRTNFAPNPGFEETSLGWSVKAAFGSPYPAAKMTRVRTQAHSGEWSLKVESLPQRINLVRSPLHDVASTGIVGWTGESLLPPIAAGNSLSIRVDPTETQASVVSSAFQVTPTEVYNVGIRYETSDEEGHQTEVWARYFTANGTSMGEKLIVRNEFLSTPVRVDTVFDVPGGAHQMQLVVKVFPVTPGAAANVGIRQVMLCRSRESTIFFWGGSGASFFWSGVPNDSASIYHPGTNVLLTGRVPTNPGVTNTLSFYTWAEGHIVSVRSSVAYWKSTGATTGSPSTTPADNVIGTWTRNSRSDAAPADAAYADIQIALWSIARGEAQYVDSVLWEQVGVVNAYFSGDTVNGVGEEHVWTGVANNSSSIKRTYSAGLTLPPAETATASTLISVTPASNIYSFGFYYTFSNEIGESAASRVTVVKTQRSWFGWRWETANGAGEPSGTFTADPTVCADQLVAYMPAAVFAAAIAAGATSWSLYMLTWSDQDPIPTSGLKVGERKLLSSSTHGPAGWLRATPDQAESTADSSAVPTLSTRYNASTPAHAGQGLVAADRMVLVYDPTSQAIIKWSSAQQGSYSDFSPSRGGGYKTLTSGNLLIPAAVKLWQNPQSADTLTILMLGPDGQSTGYYMAPATISSQSESLTIMGFEETTATPGTTSPYGCEVLNNALYHPINEMLMKSVASNYNINHSSVTDPIQNVWGALTSREHIVSSQHDNRLYYLVHNPNGALLESGCWGNEVWVFDAQQKMGSWSRWKVQGISLRKIEQAGRIVMSLVHPSGIFYFDDLAATDDYVDVANSQVKQRNIPWLLETNTQGANRAHDAWAHLQQANVVFGHLQGSVRYGVKGWDVNGKAVQVEKVFTDDNPPGTEAYDIEDYLLIRKDMKEWFFFASSHDVNGSPAPSGGQITLVQYRYSPVSVNVGYEFGSIETFEYGQAADATRNTDNGVPRTYIDTRRP